jgi:hypothetical protein
VTPPFAANDPSRRFSAAAIGGAAALSVAPMATAAKPRGINSGINRKIDGSPTSDVCMYAPTRRTHSGKFASRSIENRARHLLQELACALIRRLPSAGAAIR